MFEVNNRLRVLRVERGLTQTELSMRSGVERSSLSRIEAGKQHPFLETALRLAQALGVPVEALELR